MVAPTVLAEALIREYMTRHSLTGALRAFNEDRPKGPDAISSKTELAKTLGIERPLKRNKDKGDAALKSCLEVLAEYLSAKATAAAVDKAGASKVAAPASPSQAPASPPKTLHGSAVAPIAAVSRPTTAPAVRVAQDVPPTRKPEWVGKSPPARAMNSALAGDDLMLEELDSEDLAAVDTQGRGGRGTGVGGAGEREAMARNIPMAEVAAMKKLVFGNGKTSFNAAWTQGFFPSTTDGLSYGIVQTAGGPCGVLATVQAYMLRHLIHRDGAVPPFTTSRPEFEEALCHGLANILWQAGGGQRACVAVVAGQRRLSASEDGELRQANCRPDNVTEMLSVFDCGSHAQVLATLRRFAAELTAPAGHGVIVTLYSAILSRGVANVADDMASFEGAEAQLMGAHNYCSQEMVNLLLVGRAVGNVFDGDRQLEGATLKGIALQGEVGLLTLFEHYGSMEVGSLLKQPKVPIWVVCSESHFSVCFAPAQIAAGCSGGTLELYYYDGLSKQDAPILLTVTWQGGADKLRMEDYDRDMTPPLEHCIRTRWPAAQIDWNGTDPIL